MLVHKATTKHISDIQKIAATTWASTYTFLPAGQVEYMLELMYSTNALLQQMQNQHQFFIAQHQEKIVGFASTSLFQNSIYKLNKLYVLPEIQKIGAGKALLQSVIEFAKQKKATQLQLQVNRFNNAKDFYIKQGFTILQTANFDIGNGYVMNDYIMGLDL